MQEIEGFSRSALKDTIPEEDFVPKWGTKPGPPIYTYFLASFVLAAFEGDCFAAVLMGAAVLAFTAFPSCPFF